MLSSSWDIRANHRTNFYFATKISVCFKFFFVIESIGFAVVLLYATSQSTVPRNVLVENQCLAQEEFTKLLNYHRGYYKATMGIAQHVQWSAVQRLTSLRIANTSFTPLKTWSNKANCHSRFLIATVFCSCLALFRNAHFSKRPTRFASNDTLQQLPEQKSAYQSRNVAQQHRGKGHFPLHAYRDLRAGYLWFERLRC